ncbi:MAG: phosphoribosyltransferase family protein [Chitinophagales bacterium]
MATLAQTLIADVIALFYPRTCICCRQALLKQEEFICRNCEADLPQTNNIVDSENALTKRFTGRIPLQGAAAFYQFRKEGPVQELLHNLKYKGRQEIGKAIGELFGTRMSEPASVIKNVDLVVPVPLHWKKERKRGYNQCSTFATAIAESIGTKVSFTALERVHENISQTTQSRFDRYNNVAEIFAVKEEKQLAGKHILLVDDVVTTGATAEACLKTILTVNNTRVSFAAIAAAARY